MLLRFELHDVNINVTDIVAGMCGGYEIKRKMFNIQTMVAYLFCQQQYCDGVQHCTYGKMCTWKHHTSLRSSLCCSASSCMTSTSTSPTSSPACAAAMKLNEKCLIFKLWLLTFFVSNNTVMVYNTVHMEKCVRGSTTHPYVRVCAAPLRAAWRQHRRHRHRRRHVRLLY